MSFRAESIPRRREGSDGQRFGADFVVMEPEGRMLRGLNDTAARIWELSDGKRTARDIAGVVALEYGVDVERVLGDSLRLLEQLAGHGLLDAVEVLR
ncbi:PqqD family protein [Vitiosangium sp. GDMCC 1.1324]|uniref:PqqD family protein n=1 Tax=Vitiosangium sp. (strain GDMCC 1.1324) TaxID=2138576 RepID=UPI000D3361A6|nr:PqqD family protein [Vitiosangium sp. GDMCC 1.1324]PTL80988.1 PqqD family protein [Vitiosangium sp. GDMCC 1.1324]